MSERPITIEECAAIRSLDRSLSEYVQGNRYARDDYDLRLDALIALARPHLFLLPEAPTNTGAQGEAAAAAPDPHTGSGGLITTEGLRDALHQMWADIREGHFQPSQHDWAEDCFNYLLRELDRQSEAPKVAA